MADEAKQTTTPETTGLVVEIEAPNSKLVNGLRFPYALAAAKEGVTTAQLAAYVTANRDELLLRAQNHGCVLFRGFGVESPEDFAEVIDSTYLHNMPYVGGAAVRTNVVRDVVFTANESPPSEPIPFHHEMAQVPQPPSHLFFYCETAPTEGGETPLILSNEVYNFFSSTAPQFCAAVESKGVRYVRVMPEVDDPSSAIGRSWKSTFQVDNKADAEAKMAELGTEWEWLEGGDLRTTTATVPAIRVDPRSGKKMFFNSVVAAFTGWVDSRNDPTKAVILGDGSPVDAAALTAVAEFMTQARVCVPWQAGDIMMLDNGTVMHSRNPFAPPRRILASIARGVKAKPATLSIGAAGSGETAAMPVVGFGTWKIPREATADTVLTAIRSGYRHLDCACDYGNEAEVGAGIAAAIAEGLVTREELWITSKLWNTYHAAEHVGPALDKTLADLGLDYVDLYLIHFPIPLKFVPFETRYPPEWLYDPAAESPCMERAKVPLSETWGAMEAAVDAGKAKAIGLANYNTSLIADLLTYARIPPSVLQVELHPYNTQAKLLRFCAGNNIHVTGFSPLGAGSYVEIGMAGEGDSALREPAVVGIAAAVGRTPAQVLLRWGVQRGCSVIPKSTKADRIAENIALFEFELSAEQMASLDALNKGRRFNDPGHFCEAAFNTFTPIYE